MAAVGYAERERIRQEQGEGSLGYLLKGASTDGCCRMVSQSHLLGLRCGYNNILVYFLPLMLFLFFVLYSWFLIFALSLYPCFRQDIQATISCVSDRMCVGFLQITGVRVNMRTTPPPAPNRTAPHLHMIPTHGLHQWVTQTHDYVHIKRALYLNAKIMLMVQFCFFSVM